MKCKRLAQCVNGCVNRCAICCLPGWLAAGRSGSQRYGRKCARAVVVSIGVYQAGRRSGVQAASGTAVVGRNMGGVLKEDDVRDLAWVAANQDKLQGQPNSMIEFATTQGGSCKYEKYLYAIPIVVTINESTANLDLLQTHDWLGKQCNRILVELTQAPFEL